MDGISISDLERDERGHWQALVTNGADTFLASRRFGSWELVDHKRHCLPVLAAELQARVKRAERAEQRD